MISVTITTFDDVTGDSALILFMILITTFEAASCFSALCGKVPVAPTVEALFDLD